MTGPHLLENLNADSDELFGNGLKRNELENLVACNDEKTDCKVLGKRTHKY